jgi:hypothetical protein
VPEPEDVLPDGGPCPQELIVATELQNRFVAISDGFPVEIEAGPQGGWHVWVSARTTGLPRRGTLSWVLRSGSTVLSEPLSLHLDDSVDRIACGWEHRKAALTFAVIGEPWRGKSAELEARWEEFGGTPLIVKRGVTLR